MVQGSYIYMSELLQLQAATRGPSIVIPPGLLGVTSPLSEKWAEWDRLLAPHPDSTFRAFIISGLQEGFRIGFQHEGRRRLKSASYNLLSCSEHPEVVEQAQFQVYTSVPLESSPRRDPTVGG